MAKSLHDYDEERLWNSWGANTVASILIDGQRLNDVFTIIKTQLEILRKRQLATSDEVDNINIAIGNQASQLSSLNNLTNEEKITSAAIPHRRVSYVDQIGQIQTDLASLSNYVYNNKDLETRITKLEQYVLSQLKEQESKIESISTQLNDHNVKFMNLDTRINDLENLIVDRINHVSKLFDEKLASVELEAHRAIREVDAKSSQLKDQISVQDLRSKQLDGRISNNSKLIEGVKDLFDEIPSRYLEEIHNNIGELYNEKANRSELERKADIDAVYGKAEISDIAKLQNIADELERRIVSLMADTSDRFVGMEHKLDRRSDRIVAYCLKHLKKEMKSMGPADLENAPQSVGTDIGKVRCLVCDHVSTQHRDQDIVFSGPGITNSFKPYHDDRPRSQSPPRNNTQTNTKGYNSPPQSRNNNQHSKLVKLGGSPDVRYNPNDADDPDYIADFKFRASLSSPVDDIPNIPQNKNSIKFPTTKNTQSAPLLNIKSNLATAQFDGSENPKVFKQPNYKEMEE